MAKKKMPKISDTMTWELLARIYEQIFLFMKQEVSKWQIHYYRREINTKISTRKSKFPHIPGEPVKDEHKNARDWCLRLIPPSGHSRAHQIVITSEGEHFYMQYGTTRDQIRFHTGDTHLPLSTHHPLAHELVAAAIKAHIQQLRVV